MDDFTPRIGSPVPAPMQTGSPPGRNTFQGIRGWLLVLCLMLTVIGPLTAVWLMAEEYAANEPLFASSPGLQAAVFASLAITACAVAFGAYAGLRLWLIRPDAVATAKQALLAGLAADIVATLIELLAQPTLRADDGLFQPFTIGLVPSLVFFTLCFAYLNRSNRVHATYHRDGVKSGRSV
jgi:Protein of unknown function (DUF2569)